MSRKDYTDSPECRLIRYRADGIESRAKDHHRDMKEIFIGKEAKRLANTKGAVHPVKDDGTPLTKEDYKIIAADFVEVRHQYRIDRISTIKRDMQERAIQKIIEREKHEKQKNKAVDKALKKQPKNEPQKGIRNAVSNILSRKEKPSSEPPSTVKQKQQTVEYESDGTVKSKNTAQRTTSYSKDKNDTLRRKKINTILQQTEYKSGKEVTKEKHHIVRRDYTIGGSIEKSVHKSVERNMERKITPERSTEARKPENLSRSFTKAKSCT